MDWLLSNPQMHSMFSSLGGLQNDTYTISSNANAVLEEINCKLTCEDPNMRTFRRAIGFGQNVKLDLIPLLINAKDPTILDSAVKILVNLTVPVECLFEVNDISRTNIGHCIIFELNNLLITSKEAFMDPKSTKAIIDHMKCTLESDTKLSIVQCDGINNCLLLLRNILHIPEPTYSFLSQGHHNGSSCTTMQNTILWNLFIQSIDKVLIYLLSCPEKTHWGVTMVQLIALMYKDQHVSTLQKLLNVWFESSISESSEDNESNTSPPKQGSGDSSPMLTSDPTSDSSDNGGGGNAVNAEDRRQIALNKETESTLQEVSRIGQEYKNALMRGPTKQQGGMHHQSHQSHKSHQNHQSYHGHSQNHSSGMGPPKYSINVGAKQKDTHMKCMPQGDSNQMSQSHSSSNRSDSSKSSHSTIGKINCNKFCAQKRDCCPSSPEHSDCGYGTQVENQESISTSSNDDDGHHEKPKPPCNQKQRYNAANKQRTITPQDKKELRRKKLVKRSKSSLINMKGLVQHVPTDEDISNILKEFTVDFLLKGYSYLVQILHAQLLSDLKVQIDTSHFFWLVTYFLKFAAQLELDLEHISPVLSYDILSYLTFEGVTLCEQLELTSSQKGYCLKPFLRRIHLVVTAIREFLQALETYKKITHLSQEDRNHLRRLQIQISSAEDLRCLFVLLIRRYNPSIYSKQYLQDLIVTNHILLLLLDGVSKSTNTKANIKMTDHIEEFATVEIMYNYGLLLEDFKENGEYVNDCIFTMMHHIGGDLEKVELLYQPNILKTFSKIWETEFGLCDDWSDLIEYVIHKFMNTQQKMPLTVHMNISKMASPSLTELTKEHNVEHPDSTWTEDERESLQWYYAQAKKSKDVITKIVNLFEENGKVKKSRISIMHELLQQDIITLVQYDDIMRVEDSSYDKTIVRASTSSASTGESGIEIKETESVQLADDIELLKDRLVKENKGKHLVWLQKLLVECCYVKLSLNSSKDNKPNSDGDKIQILEAVAYHCILKNKSVPLVPWTSEQGSIMMYQPFVILLHKLGFHLPQDVRKVFARIPNFWTADILYETAQKLGPIKQSIIKFDLSLLNVVHEIKTESYQSAEESSSDTFAIPRAKRSNSVIRFTPDPASTPSVPNWLQLVMRSKCIPADRVEHDSTASSTPFVMPTLSSTFYSRPSASKMHHVLLDDDDSVMKSFDSSTEDMSLNRRSSSNLDNENSNMMTSSYDNEMSYETASVASDLTRMYVSDEEDKDE